ncbi:MAG: M48 family metallopeptidase [Pseudomonadota bacterium]|nr:M48 family metallopeptidase [Pseudomonadota bacterium]MDQ3160489.1 M48 family metallopeptidase [Pseudomonadota bacterium]
MRQDPVGNQGRQPGRGRGGLRLWVLLLFAGYAVFYWFSNRTVDPYTGEKVLIDKNLDAEDESALGLQAYREILRQEQPVDPNSQIAKQVTSIAERLISRVDEVEADLAAERGLKAGNFAADFNWAVNVIQSEQANAFALPGGKMAVYTGLVPVAGNQDGMAIVMGHEIAHALMRHGAQRMARGKLEQIGQMAGAASGMDPGMQQAVFQAYGVTSALPYARGHESQADEVGLMLAAAACFDPNEAIPLWQRMARMSGAGQKPPEFASTHPSEETRIANLQALMPKAMAYRQKYCNGAGATPTG